MQQTDQAKRTEKTAELEHGSISAVIDSEFIVTGSLHIIDMAVQSLADVEGCNDIRGSLQHCRAMIQLLLPSEAFDGDE
jgi:hypothetical protein